VDRLPKTTQVKVMSEAKRCPQCQNEMIWQRKTIRYEREGLPITLEGVWVRVCPVCGHELVPGPLAIQLMNLGEEANLPMPSVHLVFPETDEVPQSLLQPA
jgi:YgiT-type zinc finger domain-containing protein